MRFLNFSEIQKISGGFPELPCASGFAGSFASNFMNASLSNIPDPIEYNLNTMIFAALSGVAGYITEAIVVGTLDEISERYYGMQ